MEDQLFRTIMGSFATGVTVITTQVDDEIHGMTANAFMSVSLQPKLVAISIGEKAKMLGYINSSKKFAINILAANQKDLSKQFAGQLNSDEVVAFETYQGQPIIKNSLAVISCELFNQLDAGDHTVFIGRVTGLKHEPQEPLLFFEGKYQEIKE
ncbi:flavin reductase [Psychrobacillus sp. FSL K6-1267]|uniref:flavin reductase n=1 Tax=Psychrobacillus sp. FSL K6-1267 TaxID=2921543 RepID=UPI0011A13E7D